MVKMPVRLGGGNIDVPDAGRQIVKVMSARIDDDGIGGLRHPFRIRRIGQPVASAAAADGHRDVRAVAAGGVRHVGRFQLGQHISLGVAEQNLLSAEGGGQAAGMQFIGIDMVAREGAYDDVLLKARGKGRQMDIRHFVKQAGERHGACAAVCAAHLADGLRRNALRADAGFRRRLLGCAGAWGWLR